GDAETDAAARKAATGVGVDIVVATVDRPGHLPPLQEGIARATSPVIAFLDDDCEPWPQWAASLAVHYADRTIGGVGGLVAQPGVSDRLTARRLGRFGIVPRIPRAFSARIPLRWGPRSVDVIMGANMSYRAELLRTYEWDGRM